MSVIQAKAETKIISTYEDKILQRSLSWIESFPDVPLEGSGVKGTDIGPRRENKSKRFQAQKNVDFLERQLAI